MRRPRVTINTAMLAAAIGIDRLVEGNIGAVVACNDGAGRRILDFSFERGQFAKTFPAIVKALALFAIKTAGGIGESTTPAAQISRHDARPGGTCTFVVPLPSWRPVHRAPHLIIYDLEPNRR